MKNNLNLPLVTVIIPVYNAAKFLPEAIESIINQTYENIELILIDDASVDNSYEIALSYQKKYKNIIVLKNDYNIGVSASINKAWQIAKGSFMGRMDADDISYPDRIEKQVEYLLKNKSIIAVSGFCHITDSYGNIQYKKDFPLNHKDILKNSFSFTTLQEGSILIARNRLPEHFNLYDRNWRTAENIEAVYSLSKYGKLANIPHYLIKYRFHSDNISKHMVKYTFYLTIFARIKGVFIYGFAPSITDIIINIAQLIIVSLLPNQIILWLYQKIRFSSITATKTSQETTSVFISS